MDVVVLYWGVSAKTAEQYWLRLGAHEYLITRRLAHKMIDNNVPVAPADSEERNSRLEHDDQTLLIRDALRLARRVERRLIGMHSGILNATRNADRLVLANEVDSLRLDLDTIVSLLEEESIQPR